MEKEFVLKIVIPIGICSLVVSICLFIIILRLRDHLSRTCRKRKKFRKKFRYLSPWLNPLAYILHVTWTIQGIALIIVVSVFPPEDLNLVGQICFIVFIMLDLVFSLQVNLLFDCVIIQEGELNENEKHLSLNDYQTVKTFVQAVHDMRAAQKDYYSSRSPTVLPPSKSLETEVDSLLKAVEKMKFPGLGDQQELFDAQN